MKRFVIEGLYDIAEAMYNEIANKGKNEVMFVGFYEDAIEVIKELMMFDEVMPHSLEIHPVDWDWYDREYYVTLDKNLELWCEEGYNLNEDNEFYYESEADVLFIADDCNSVILRKIEAEEVVEVTYGLEEDDFEEECDGCCGKCCCHDKHNEESNSVADSSMTTRVAVDNEGRIRGFEKTWKTDDDGVHYYHYYKHFSDDAESLRRIMDNLGIELK